MAKTPTPTAEQIQNATPEELAHYNEILGKKIVKRFMINFAVSVGVVVAATLVGNALEKKLGDGDESDSSESND